eukprot:2726442-Rhodomonas_salina.2
MKTHACILTARRPTTLWTRTGDSRVLVDVDSGAVGSCLRTRAFSQHSRHGDGKRDQDLRERVLACFCRHFGVCSVGSGEGLWPRGRRESPGHAWRGERGT